MAQKEHGALGPAFQPACQAGPRRPFWTLDGSSAVGLYGASTQGLVARTRIRAGIFSSRRPPLVSGICPIGQWAQSCPMVPAGRKEKAALFAPVSVP